MSRVGHRNFLASALVWGPLPARLQRLTPVDYRIHSGLSIIAGRYLAARRAYARLHRRPGTPNDRRRVAFLAFTVPGVLEDGLPRSVAAVLARLAREAQK